MQRLGDEINKLCNAHFASLPQKGKPSLSQWTVMSAVVMEKGGELSVISMATGTKCVGENDRSMFVVSDSHAEILSLRLFRLYLLHQMLGLRDDDDGVLERGERGFSVKSGVFFHFFTSCVMCGDATIHIPSSCDVRQRKRPPSPCNEFSPKQLKSSSPSSHDPSVSPTPSSTLSADMTRSGGKCLISDDLSSDSIQTRAWHLTSVVRTKPGRGPLSLSLSCSDKLMKRHCLGLQGGLLSPLIEQPIRFKSFVIGGLFSQESVTRALFTRLPPHLQHPVEIIGVDDIFSNSLANCPSLSSSPASMSLLWCHGVGQWAGVKGRQQGATKSSAEEKVMLPVCRANMLKLTLDVTESISLVGQCPNPKMSCEYEDVRNLSPYYKEKKSQFCAHFDGWRSKVERRDKISRVS